MKIYYKIFLWKFKRIPTQVAQVHIQFSGKRPHSSVLDRQNFAFSFAKRP